MVNDIAVQDFVNAIKETPTDTNTTYQATVSRIDDEGVVWVCIHGSEKETPTASTSAEVKRGDSVTVQWRSNKLYIGGNYSNPSAGIGTVMPSVDFVTELIDKDITVNSINAATGYIGELTSKKITAEDITADHATIKELDVESMAAATAYIRELTADNITAEDIATDHATVGNLDANYAQINAANVTDLSAQNAWVNKIMVQTGLLAHEGTVFTLDAIQVNAANITAGTIDVNRLIVTVDGQKYLVNVNPSTGTPTYEKLDGNVVEPRTITADKIVAHDITVQEITTENLVGTNGWINLNQGKFFYGNGASYAASTNAIDWNGTTLKIKGDIGDSVIFNNYSTTTEMNTAIGNAVDDIEVGGRNLILNTGAMPINVSGGFRSSGLGTLTHETVSDPPLSDISGCLRVSNNTSGSLTWCGFAQDNRENTFRAGEIYTQGFWIRTNRAFTANITIQPIFSTSSQAAAFSPKTVNLTTQWQYVKGEGARLTGDPTDSYSCGYIYVGTLPANTYFEVCGLKIELGNKATEWTPAPEDVQANIDAKTSIHTLTASYSEGQPYRTILGWCAEGTVGTWGVTSTSGVSVGDTVRIAYKVSDMGTAGNRPSVYCIGTVTRVDSATAVTITSHGLDTTIIDGGNILTNSIGANQLDANSINVSKSLTIGALSDSTKNDVLNSNVSVGGKNIALTTGARVYPTSYNCARIPICERLEAGVTYTFQMWGVSVNNTNTGTNWIRAYWGGGNNGLGEAKMPDSKGYYCTTFTVDSNMVARDPDSWHWYLNIYNSNEATARQFSVKRWKLERGNKPTDWSPCPADNQGGENLLRGTREMMNGGGGYNTGTFRASGGTLGHINFTYTNTSPSPELKGFITITNTGSSAVNIGLAQDGISNKAIVGKTYTQSCWVTCSSSANGCTFYLQPWWTSASYLSSSPNIKLISDAWQYVEFSGTLTGTQQETYSGGYAYGVNIPAGGAIYIAGMKLEEGSIGNGWAPARDDADASTYIYANSSGIRIASANPSTQNQRIELTSSDIKMYDNQGYQRMLMSGSAGVVVGKTDSGHTTVMDDGLHVWVGAESTATNEVAFYGNTARVGKSSTRHIEVKDGGMQVYQDASTVMAHIGYGSGNSQSGTDTAPYFTFGTRWTDNGIGNYSVVEGMGRAIGYCSHAEGWNATAQGTCSHAEGTATQSKGYASHAGGTGTIANGDSQTAIGKYNIADTSSLFIVGSGSGSNSRSNAFAVSNIGVYVNGTQVHSSDRRLKEHISYVGDEAVEFIDGLKPAHYIKDGIKHVGFYAQDVKEVDEWDCMTGEMNGYMTLGYMELLAPMVAYIQRLEKRIEELERSK